MMSPYRPYASRHYVGALSGNYVYNFPIFTGFKNRTWSKEMVNILILIRLFKFQWALSKVLIRSDNEPVVTILKSVKTENPILCEHKIWYISAMSDIDLQYAHIRATDNKIGDVLSRWQGTPEQMAWLH